MTMETTWNTTDTRHVQHATAPITGAAPVACPVINVTMVQVEMTDSTGL